MGPRPSGSRGVRDHLCSLHDVEAAEVRIGGHAAATTDHSCVGCRVEPPVLGGGEGGLQLIEDSRDPTQVLRIGVRDQIEIRRATEITVSGHRHPTDHDEADFSLMQPFEQGAQIQRAQRPTATPLMVPS